MFAVALSGAATGDGATAGAGAGDGSGATGVPVTARAGALGSSRFVVASQAPPAINRTTNAAAPSIGSRRERSRGGLTGVVTSIFAVALVRGMTIVNGTSGAEGSALTPDRVGGRRVSIRSVSPKSAATGVAAGGESDRIAVGVASAADVAIDWRTASRSRRTAAQFG